MGLLPAAAVAENVLVTGISWQNLPDIWYTGVNEIPFTSAVESLDLQDWRGQAISGGIKGAPLGTFGIYTNFISVLLALSPYNLCICSCLFSFSGLVFAWVLHVSSSCPGPAGRAALEH